MAAATPQSNSLLNGLGDLLGDLFGGSSSIGNHITGGITGGASLPINNNLWFLVIAGAAIGCKVIINKSKTPAVQPAKI